MKLKIRQKKLYFIASRVLIKKLIVIFNLKFKRFFCLTSDIFDLVYQTCYLYNDYITYNKV